MHSPAIHPVISANSMKLFSDIKGNDAHRCRKLVRWMNYRKKGKGKKKRKKKEKKRANSEFKGQSPTEMESASVCRTDKRLHGTSMGSFLLFS